MDRDIFWSLAELADAAEKYGNKYRTRYLAGNDAKAGNVTFHQALTLGRNGWTAKLDSTLELAESAVTMADKEHVMESFNQPVWDVTGAQVDVGAYLAGTPECMIDYPLSPVSKQGRVITLCASVAYSWAIKGSTIEKRGQVITALAMALIRLGHAVELWADITADNHCGELHSTRVLIKGANDELDPARVMFAYAHPAMLRVLEWSAREKWGDKYSPGHSMPASPEQNLPEGTIYLPELLSGVEVPDADEFLRKYLGELGLLAE